ncbi:MAG: isochorismatase family protein [Deltaproteobacteria bacterium]|nr:isochorismatase family protein [Deltaproteobacteria bacterium]
MSDWFETEARRRRERLLRARAALLIVDIQERLAPAMPPDVAAQVIKNTAILVAAAARLGVPIIVSQQYPKGLGQTVPELVAALAAAETDHGAAVYRFDKVEFSAAASEAFQALPPAEKIGAMMTREQWIVCGMETHVCVYQTVRDLAGPACAVHVVADAVASRTKANWRLGLELSREAGAMITSTEVCVFDLLEQAGTEEFKALSKLIK